MQRRIQLGKRHISTRFEWLFFSTEPLTRFARIAIDKRSISTAVSLRVQLPRRHWSRGVRSWPFDYSIASLTDNAFPRSTRIQNKKYPGAIRILSNPSASREERSASRTVSSLLLPPSKMLCAYLVSFRAAFLRAMLFFSCAADELSFWTEARDFHDAPDFCVLRFSATTLLLASCFRGTASNPVCID